MADFYGVLNVQKGATDSDLKRAYRKLARRWHPDKNPGDPEANNKFQEVSRAYEVLIDREKRAIYDQYGEDGLVNGIPGEDDSGGFPATVNAHETFERFFGTANPFADFGFGDSMPFASSMSKSGPEQTPAVTSDLACTLEELFNGCTKRLSVERQRLGATGGNLVADEKVLTIHIKPGWKKGTKITFPQQGDEAPGKLPADLIFVVAEQPHDTFVREGNNLVHTAKVTLLQALTDCVVNVPTLDGRTLPIPCHDVLSPGYSLTIPGEGMPISGSEGERGDLIIKFDIEFPAQGALNAEKKKKLAEVLG